MWTISCLVVGLVTSPLDDIFQDPLNTVDKLNKSKLMGKVNVNKMVLPLVSCWWCSLLLLLSREHNNQLLQSVVMAGSGW
jgi:hypothetical protein